MDRVGKYQIVEKIGAGGFSEVYKGFDPLIKRHVAIKTCTAQDAELRSRFFQEAEIAGRAQHRNIVTVFDFGFEGEMPYLVQEYLTGEDLDRKVKRGEPVDLATKLDLLHQIALGLAHAHKQGIIHRDIKPGNIRILEDGTAKIMDFGIAKFLQEDTNLTKTGMTVGTAAYLAPEQIRGHSADPRTDVFSFGVLAYELLTLSRPFAGEQISAVLYQILNEKPDQLVAKVPDCPPKLANLVMRCLMKTADDRPADGAHLVRALESVRRTLDHDGHDTPDFGDRETVPFELSGAGDRMPGRAAAAGGVAEFDLHTGRVTETVEAPVAGASIARRAKSSRFPASLLIALLVIAGLVWLGRGELFRSFGDDPARPQVAERAAPPAAAAAQGESLDPGADTEALPAATGESPGQQPLNPPARNEPLTSGPADELPADELPVDELPVTISSGQETPPLPVPPPPASPPSAPPPSASPPSAPPPSAPIPQPATLMISPAWDPTITVAIDGKTPRPLASAIRQSLSPGRHRLRFRIDVAGYRQEHLQEVEAVAGRPLRINQPFKPPGSLTVQAKPGGLPAVVLLDGEKIGDGRKVALGFLAPGDHQLVIQSLQGVANTHTLGLKVTVVPSQTTIVTYDLESTTAPTVRQRGGESEPEG